ncbi:hypothetical protein B0H66DRAFT_68883 [Apodospora peruviana]|uniref:Uncharacterized protein n=1 Tax=Apodospora peruviana TaxID=516989 RepID=A0AAE0ISR7_9PEZI|nr:hypothetical protein B0H66DRAFT_68883 [Apodospora peruviana]
MVELLAPRACRVALVKLSWLKEGPDGHGCWSSHFDILSSRNASPGGEVPGRLDSLQHCKLGVLLLASITSNSRIRKVSPGRVSVRVGRSRCTAFFASFSEVIITRISGISASFTIREGIDSSGGFIPKRGTARGELPRRIIVSSLTEVRSVGETLVILFFSRWYAPGWISVISHDGRPLCRKSLLGSSTAAMEGVLVHLEDRPNGNRCQLSHDLERTAEG